MDYILTNSGAVMMTQVAAGRTLLFTRTESGSGYSASPAVLQSVIDKKQDMFLDEVTYENKQAVVKSVLSNMQLEEEYQLRQVGVYAKLEGDETDTLLLIGQQYNGEKIPSYHDGIMQIEYNIAIKASGTGNITIEGVGTGYVTKGQFLAHLNDHSNPHKVTAKDVNLDKVPNVGTDDQTPEFEEAEERENISSLEKMSVLFGKIKKWLTDIKDAAFCSVANNLVTTLSGSVLDARQGKTLQDQITGLYSDLGGIIHATGIAPTGAKKICISSKTVICLLLFLDGHMGNTFTTFLINGYGVGSTRLHCFNLGNASAEYVPVIDNSEMKVTIPLNTATIQTEYAYLCIHGSANISFQ